MEYITGKESQNILNITTRQGLNKIVKNNNITVKSQGAGKPNLYLKSDIEKYKKDNKKNIVKYKPKSSVKKDIVKKQRIIKKKETIEKIKEETKKDLQLDNVPRGTNKQELNNEDLQNPLNEIGQNEFNRMVELLKDMGTYKDADRSLVLAYSISYQKYIYSTVASAKEDDTTMDDFGNLKIHPYMIVADKALSQMVKIGQILGVGIRSRIGIETKEKKKETIFDIIRSKDNFD